MKNLIFSLAILAIAITACNSGSKDTASQDNNVKDTTDVASEKVSANASPIESILNTYFTLKML